MGSSSESIRTAEAPTRWRRLIRKSAASTGIAPAPCCLRATTTACATFPPPPGTTVVHKVGFISGYLNDSALVLSGPRGSYVLSICTRNSSSGWALLASISHAVWNFEATR